MVGHILVSKYIRTISLRINSKGESGMSASSITRSYSDGEGWDDFSYSDTHSRSSSSSSTDSTATTTHSGRYGGYHRSRSGSARGHSQRTDNQSRHDISHNNNNRNHINCGICLQSVAGPTTTPCGHDSWEDEEEKKDLQCLTYKTSIKPATLLINLKKKVAEKLRLQKLQEGKDLKTALEIPGILPETYLLDAFNPQTKEEVKEFKIYLFSQENSNGAIAQMSSRKN
uniref:Uncharacterized protein n=1 Tax=Glossina palpalis gambiensis TaxID=67801 RepID=A0A1B0BU29_9MUSC